MIRRLYVNNFRCLENFELALKDQHSVLLIGKNGAGKTTVFRALEVLQKIARGSNRVADLIRPSDLTRQRTEVPLRIALQVELANELYDYEIAFEFPSGFKELRVREEKLSVDGQLVFGREAAAVRVSTKQGATKESEFRIDWHLVALPIIQERNSEDPLSIFKKWLSRMLLLRPLPSLMDGESNGETLFPNADASNFASWFSGLLADAPSAYTTIDSYLKLVLPDLADVKNPIIGKDSRNLIVHFGNQLGSTSIPFGHLSDGEKCFMVCSLVLATKKAYESVLCFWDEPDNHLALSEVAQFIIALRTAFKAGGQFIATSHNPEAIRSFSNENTYHLRRRSHLEPTIIQPLAEIDITGDLIGSIVRDDLVS